MSDMLLSGRSLLGRVALPLLHSVEKFISIRSSASHPDKAGIEFPICLLSLGGTLFRRSLPVNTILGKEVGTDMDGVVNIVGEMCNLPQLLQLLVQFVEIRHGRRSQILSKIFSTARVSLASTSSTSGISPVALFCR